MLTDVVTDAVRILPLALPVPDTGRFDARDAATTATAADRVAELFRGFDKGLIIIRGRVVPSVIGYFNERDKPITLWSANILGTLVIDADDKGDADDTTTVDAVEIVRSPIRHAY